MRLDQLRKLPEAHALLAKLDKPDLLSEASAMPVDVDELGEDALLAEFGVSSDPSDHADITVLRHVRTRAARQAAEEIAGPHAVRGLRQVPAQVEVEGSKH